jgi:hypothetical protein
LRLAGEDRKARLASQVILAALRDEATRQKIRDIGMEPAEQTVRPMV